MTKDEELKKKGAATQPPHGEPNGLPQLTEGDVAAEQGYANTDSTKDVSSYYGNMLNPQAPTNVAGPYNAGGGNVKPQPSSERFNGLDDVEEYIRGRMEANKPESEADRKKRERREKWEGIISGIGDMGMALGNLFYTTKGAPSSYSAADGMSVKAKQRFEKAKADREKNEDRYLNYALSLRKLLKEREDEARKKELERRQDEAYQYELSRRPFNEEHQNETLKALRDRNNRNSYYNDLAYLQDEYNNGNGNMSYEEYLERLSELKNAYNGKYGKYGTTYSRTTSPRGTSTTVRTNDQNQLQEPVAAPAKAATGGGRGGRSRSGGRNGRGGSSNSNTPPSRRNNNNNNDNTPPSRR